MDRSSPGGEVDRSSPGGEVDRSSPGGEAMSGSRCSLGGLKTSCTSLILIRTPANIRNRLAMPRWLQTVREAAEVAAEVAKEVAEEAAVAVATRCQIQRIPTFSSRSPSQCRRRAGLGGGGGAGGGGGGGAVPPLVSSALPPPSTHQGHGSGTWRHLLYQAKVIQKRRMKQARMIQQTTRQMQGQVMKKSRGGIMRVGGRRG